MFIFGYFTAVHCIYLGEGASHSPDSTNNAFHYLYMVTEFDRNWHVFRIFSPNIIILSFSERSTHISLYPNCSNFQFLIFYLLILL